MCGPTNHIGMRQTLFCSFMRRAPHLLVRHPGAAQSPAPRKIGDPHVAMHIAQKRFMLTGIHSEIL